MNIYTGSPLYESDIWQELTDGLRRPGGLELTEYAVRTAGLEKPKRILDLGCGAGTTAAYLSNRFGFEVTGLDKSEVLIKEAESRFPGCNFVLAEAESVPFEDGCFDAVTAECSLSLCSEPVTVFFECFRILKPGGKLIITDMYNRLPGDSDLPEKAGLETSCFRSLRAESQWRELIVGPGFTLLEWEERNRDLASLTAKIIFEYGSLCAFLKEMKIGAACGARPGYFLAVAEKEE